MDRTFQQHLARMHKKHEDCLDALGRATVQARTLDENDASHADERFKPFVNMPIYGLMTDVLSFRRLASQFDGDKSAGKFRLILPL